ncbi:signal transduction histidine kinase [Pseudarthrobacter siccitolerans]|uniref:histidine kinase n=1 Tax=Pseudarthrobacter siccitolerans TaxID=861266 RepID=A0ABU0PSL6_9MICC|nr:histidine kinase [Pseudarthrobacter siccitolerans]MDQ0676221.1 signal transduction histidine kinase [Pseudarthrobacter siccitolerans]
MQRRFRGPPTAFIVVAVAVFQIVGTVFASARQPDHRPVDALAVALLLLGPAALSLRRRAPLVMLPVTAAAVGAYLAMGYAWGPIFLSLALAIVFSAAAGKRWQTWGVAGVCAAVLVAVSLQQGDEASLVRAFAATSWLAILVLLGEGVRLRTERVAERRRQHEAREQAARDEYRLTLARDIHDVVAHSLSLINVRASVALHLGEKDPEQFRPALLAIKTASKESLAEIRQLLGVLRDDAPLSPSPLTIGRVQELVDHARRAGIDVRLDLDLPVQTQLPGPVQEAAYRIVQESLTNVVRHSWARKAAVVLALETAGAAGAGNAGGLLSVTIDDDGAGATGVPEGNGVTGMRERAAGLGGTLEVTALRPGWRVRSVLPVPAGPWETAARP